MDRGSALDEDSQSMDRAEPLDEAKAADLSIFEIATSRWLHVEEIISLLSPETTPLCLSSAPPSTPPPSGTVLLYDRSSTRNYKADGYEWIKKRNSNKVREDHVKLRWQGQYRVAGSYVHSAASSTLHRRAYRLIGDPNESPGSSPSTYKSGPDWVLLHYLDTMEAVRVSAYFADHLAAAASRTSNSETSASSDDESHRKDWPVYAEHVASAASKVSGIDMDDQLKNEAMGTYGHEKQVSGGKHHKVLSSLDDATMDILWNMVVEETNEDVTDELQDAAAAAIQQHMTTLVEEELAGTVENIIQDVASSVVEEQMDPTFFSDDDISLAVEKVVGEKEIAPKIEEKVVSALENRLPAHLEQKLVETMEKELGAASIESARLGAKDVSSAPETTPSMGGQTPPSSHEIPQTPLPEVIDITPSEACMNSTKDSMMIISTSAAIPLLPPDDLPHRWHLLAAFVDMNSVAEFSDSSRAASPAYQVVPETDPKIKKVALAYLKKVTPFSYKCAAPKDISYPGSRSIILIGVRYVDNPETVWDAIRMAVTVTIQAEWHVASDLSDGKAKIGSDLVRPTFHAPAGGENVQLLSQLSREVFTFYCDESLPHPIVEGAEQKYEENFNHESSCCKSFCSTKSDGQAENLPAPAPAMASVASALTSFSVNPPSQALGVAKTISRKRTHSKIPDLDELTCENEVDAANEAAKTWASSQAPNSDVTLGESVDRHCKIRFVERLANAVISTEEDNTAKGAAANPEQIFLDGEQLQIMGDDELDSLLDGVLMRFVESLVDTCASEEDLKKELNATGFSGFALLHYAALYNMISLVPLLLSRGADPNQRTSKGDLTPLHLACGAGNDQVVNLLVRNGCKVDVQDSFGLTPADHATRNGFVEISKWLHDKCPEASRLGGLEKSLPLVDGKDDLIQSAFQGLPLKDKLGLNLFVQKYRMEAKAYTASATDKSSDSSASSAMDEGVSVDVERKQVDNGKDGIDFKFISEKDRESLKVAMSLMSSEEVKELEKNAPLADVRKWMLRSNYESLREASAQLEKQSKRKLLSERAHSTSSGSTLSIEEKRSLSNAKLSQALAMLVLRKNLVQPVKGTVK